jgi:hypothetical protein
VSGFREKGCAMVLLIHGKRGTMATLGREQWMNRSLLQIIHGPGEKCTDVKILPLKQRNRRRIDDSRGLGFEFLRERERRMAGWGFPSQPPSS